MDPLELPDTGAENQTLVFIRIESTLICSAISPAHLLILGSVIVPNTFSHLCH